MREMFLPLFLLQNLTPSRGQEMDDVGGNGYMTKFVFTLSVIESPFLSHWLVLLLCYLLLDHQEFL